MRAPAAIVLSLAVCAVTVITGMPVRAAAADAAVASFGDRPRVGLVLAGGGAKGGAHVGVLKVLEELHIPVDCIAGTSMGALIGGGYAAGLPAAELEKFVSGIDWKAVVGGAGRRAQEPIEQKRLAAGAGTGLQFGYVDRRFVAPSGLVKTSAIDDLLRRYVANSRNARNFDELPIPFRAVATDMVAGEMVVLEDGDLATAMRASMAIPGAFSPVVGGGRVLTDGGMVRNIPVDIARQTCADVVIVVNLVEPETPPEKLVRAGQLLARSMDVMLKANEKEQLRTLTERDVLIDVPMGDIGTADFERTPETIPLGEAAARRMAEQLARFAVPESAYVAWRQRVTTTQMAAPRLADVRFEGLKWVNPEFLRTRTQLRAGDAADIDAISADVLSLSALEEIDSVPYRLEGERGSPTLVWSPSESSLGRHVLRPGMGIYASGGGDLKFQVSLQYVQRWMNARGGQWRNQLHLGYESVLDSSFYQPIDVAQRFFVEPGFFVSRTAEDVFIDGERGAAYSFRDLGGRLDFGWNVNHNVQLRTGYWTSDRRSKVVTGGPLLPELEGRDAGIVASAIYDSRDQPGFSREGFAAQLEYFNIADGFGADRDWERIEAGVHFAVPWRDNVISLTAAGGADLGDQLPPDRAFTLGGERTLPSFQLDELRAREYWLVRTDFLWPLIDLNPVKGQALYVGFGLQGAGVYDRVDRVEDAEFLGASAFLAGPTPIGTVTLGVGYAQDSAAFWLSIGRPIGKGSIVDNGMLR